MRTGLRESITSVMAEDCPNTRETHWKEDEEILKKKGKVSLVSLKRGALLERRALVKQKEVVRKKNVIKHNSFVQKKRD